MGGSDQHIQLLQSEIEALRQILEYQHRKNTSEEETRLEIECTKLLLMATEWEHQCTKLHDTIKELTSERDKYRSESEYYYRKYTEALQQTTVQKAAARSYDDNHPGWDVS